LSDWDIGAKASLSSTFSGTGAEGLRGFYAGLLATMSREVPFAVIQMTLHEEIKRQHPLATLAQGDARYQGVVGTTSGCLAGAVAGATTTPFDLTKTRIMLTKNPAERAGMLATVRTIYREGGIRGLFAGVAPRTLYTTMGGAVVRMSSPLTTRLKTTCAVACVLVSLTWDLRAIVEHTCTVPCIM